MLHKFKIYIITNCMVIFLTLGLSQLHFFSYQNLPSFWWVLRARSLSRGCSSLWVWDKILHLLHFTYKILHYGGFHFMLALKKPKEGKANAINSPVFCLIFSVICSKRTCLFWTFSQHYNFCELRVIVGWKSKLPFRYNSRLWS